VDDHPSGAAFAGAVGGLGFADAEAVLAGVGGWTGGFGDGELLVSLSDFECDSFFVVGAWLVEYSFLYTMPRHEEFMTNIGVDTSRFILCKSSNDRTIFAIVEINIHAGTCS